MSSLFPEGKSGRWTAVFCTIAWALFYAAMVWLGRASRLDGTQTALVWPAAGVAVLWLRGTWARPRRLGANVVLLWLVTVAINFVTGAPLALSCAFGTANTTQALVTCAVLAMRPGSLGAADGSGALLRLAGAAFVGTTVGALAGPASLQLYSSLAWPIDAPVWIFRNGTSTFVLVSTAVAFSSSSRRGALTNKLETSVVLAAAAGVTLAVFAGVDGVPLAFAIVPASVVVGLRLGVGAASLHTVFTWIVVVACTFAGRGPFTAHSADERVMLTQALVLVIAFSTLTLAHSRKQERELEERLEDERGVVAALVEQLSTDLFICDEHGRLSGFDVDRKALVPLDAETGPERWPELFGAYTPDGSRMLDPTELPLYRALHGETVGPTEMMLRDPAQDRIFMVSASPIHDAAGRSRGAVARAADVTALRRAESDATERAADLAAAGRVAHELAMQTDTSAARQLICTAARQTAGASMTMLFEPHPDGRRLICTAADGYDEAQQLEIPFSGLPSGAVIAFSSAQPFFVATSAGHPAVNQHLIAQMGIASGLWQPVIKDGLAIAVLAVGWKTKIEAVPARATAMLDLLAAEAALAIDRANLIAQLDDIAHTDPLTGARNRRALTQRLAGDQARARQSGQPLSVLMLDLDHFKAFNDQHGHQHGDRLLKEAVAAWEAEARPTDTIARYGGEEFAIVLPGCALEDAVRLADRLRHVVPHQQTASIGVAEWSDEESCDDLIARADAALYRAKHAGRDQVVRADRSRGTAPAVEAGYPPASTCQMVLGTTRRLLGMDLAFLAQVTADQLVFLDLEGDLERFGLAAGDAIPLADSYCQRMLDGRIDGRVSDSANNQHVANLAVTADAGIAAYIGAPVQLSDGRVVGTLCGLRATRAVSLSDEDVELIRGLAQTVASSLQDQLGPDPTPADIAAAWKQTIGHSKVRQAET